MEGLFRAMLSRVGGPKQLKLINSLVSSGRGQFTETLSDQNVSSSEPATPFELICHVRWHGRTFNNHLGSSIFRIRQWN